MSEAPTGSPAGNPSTITTRARPCDSPAVRKRSTQQRYRTANAVLEPRGPRPRSEDLLVEGVVAPGVVCDVEHAGELGHLFEQCRLDPLSERHLRHGATLAPAREAQVGAAVLVIEGDQIGPSAMTGNGRVDGLFEDGDHPQSQWAGDALGQDFGRDAR